MGRLIDQYIQNETQRQRMAHITKLAAVFAKRANRHDREGSFPFENFTDLKKAGYLKLTVPQAYGGDEISLYEMVQAQERLAYGDGSTALGVGWHLGQMLYLRTSGKWPEAMFASFCRAVVEEGVMLNVFASEASSGSPSRGGKPETNAVRTAGGWLITGRKTFSTLAPLLDRFVVTAYVPEEDTISEFLVHVSEQVKIEETWDTLGMRGTGSHDVVLEQAFAAADARISGKGMDEGAGWLLHIPACYMGIALAARDVAVNFAATYQPSSTHEPIAKLPLVQQSIGKMEAELRTARCLLYAVADRWDRHEDLRAELRTELGLAKYTVIESALKIVDLAMRIVGGTSLSKKLPLERYYRDIRAGLHNPPMENTVLQMLAVDALKEQQPN